MAISEELKIVVKTEVSKAIAELKKFQTQTDKSKKGVKSFGNEVKGMALKLGGAAAAIALVRRGLTAALDATKLAADATQVEMAFNSMAKGVGEDGAEVLRRLSMAAGGTIDSLALMKQASRALVFNIPAAELQKLMQIARASATATGESVEQMFNSIVTGVARGSRMLLDNLGIIVNVEDATRDYAASIGRTVESLTAAERSQATLNAVLESGVDIMERVGEAGRTITDAERFQRATAAMKDLKIEMGRNLLEAVRPVVIAFGDMAIKSAEAAKNARLLNSALKQLREGETVDDTEEKLRVAKELLEVAKSKIKTDQFAQINIMVAQQVIDALEQQLALERTLEGLQVGKRMAAAAAAQGAIDLAAKEAKAARDILDWVSKVNTAWAETPEGRKTAAEADIAMWETMLKSANLTAPQIEDILRELKKQFDEAFGVVSGDTEAGGQLPFEKARNELGLMQEELARMGTGQDIDVAAILAGGAVEEGAIAYKKATAAVALYNDELMRMGAGQDIDVAAVLKDGATQIEETKEQFLDLSDVITDTVLNAFGLLGEALVTGEEGWAKFAKGVVGSMAAVLDSLAQQMFVIGLAKTALATLNPGAAFAAAAASAVAAGIIRGALASMEEGGVTQKEGLYHLHPGEAVIPLDKAMGGDTIIIMGDLLTQEEAYARVGEYQQRRGRRF